jgi:hypothetical protein
LIGQQNAKIRAKKRRSTAYLALKALKQSKTVCARTVCLSVPVMYSGYCAWFHLDLAKNCPNFQQLQLQRSEFRPRFSIPYLVLNLVNSILCISSIDRAERYSTDGNFSFYCKSARCLIFLPFESIGISYGKRVYILKISPNY